MAQRDFELSTWRNCVLRGETIEGFIKWKLNRCINTVLITTKAKQNASDLLVALHKLTPTEIKNDSKPKKALQGAASKDS
jgi:hypothetical protein